MNPKHELNNTANVGNVSLNINEFCDLLGENESIIPITDRDILQTGLYGWWQNPLREIHVTKTCAPGEIKFDGKPVSTMPTPTASVKMAMPVDKTVTRLK